jgi:hypothetical protein
MPRHRPSAGRVVCALLAVAGAMLAGPAHLTRAGAETRTLDGETLAGAFVTMTPGARCPSISDVAFSAQGEASGSVEGLFDLTGTLGLTRPGGGSGMGAFSARLDVNQGRLAGTLHWDARDAPLALSCDPLSFRLDGEARYAVTDPFTDEGRVELHAYGSRSAVTAPYFGRATLTFRSTRSARPAGAR